MEAVKQNAKALQYASRNYVLAAVTNDGLALQYVSRNFVLAAVKKDALLCNTLLTRTKATAKTPLLR